MIGNRMCLKISQNFAIIFEKFSHRLGIRIGLPSQKGERGRESFIKMTSNDKTMR